MAHNGELYIELVTSFPEDRDVRKLNRHKAAARGLRDLYVQCLLYCKRATSDGFVPCDEIALLVYPDSERNGLRDALRLADCGLLLEVEGGFYAPAYLKRNPSRAEVESAMTSKSEGGKLGNHRRWHTGGKTDRSCKYCADRPGPESDSRSDTDQSTDRYTDNEANRSRSPETETETETETTTKENGSEDHTPTAVPPARNGQDPEPPLTAETAGVDFDEFFDKTGRMP